MGLGDFYSMPVCSKCEGTLKMINEEDPDGPEIDCDLCEGSGVEPVDPNGDIYYDPDLGEWV